LAPIDRSTLVLTDAGGKLVARRWIVEVIAGPDRGKSIAQDSGVIIVGSHPDADFSLSDDSVSRHHAELRLLAEGVEVVDLDSTNGTKVGRVRVQRALIPPGETVTLGQCQLLVRPDDRPIEQDEGPSVFGDFITEHAEQRKV